MSKVFFIRETFEWVFGNACGKFCSSKSRIRRTGLKFGGASKRIDGTLPSG